MDALVRRAFAALVRTGSLTVTTASGQRFVFGDGSEPEVAIRFTSRWWQAAVLFDPSLKLGEAYMDRGVIVEKGTIAEFLDIVMRRPVEEASFWLLARIYNVLRFLFRRIEQANWRRAARRNVQHHYDLSDTLYTLFLDNDRQYSCAYFEKPEQPLDDAQRAKKRHLAAKLLLEADQRVLDIGCGWGGLALYFAEVARAKVRGITLSDHQLAIARGRAQDGGITQRAEFVLEDYRDTAGRFDRIVSVGMLEHVGVPHLRKFFAKVHDLLSEDGVALIHAIGRSEGPGSTNAWISRYIFPGGYIPALSEVLPAIERAGFLVADIEILRLHYALTLKAWRERFMARLDEAQRLYDERFCRMWEFYLASCEMAFRHQGLMVFQIQLAKHEGVVPITRSYIGRARVALEVLGTWRQNADPTRRRVNMPQSRIAAPGGA